MAEFIVTDCPIHGVKVTSDYDSFVIYVGSAQADDHDRKNENLGEHLANHDAAHESCWVCCRFMVIDPYGLLDH